MIVRIALATLVLAFAGCAANAPTPEVVLPVAPEPEAVPPPRIALVFGGGAAKAFAHIGVI